MFKQKNLLLQREDHYIHFVHSQLDRLLMKLAGKFMTVAEIRSASQYLYSQTQLGNVYRHFHKNTC